MKLQVRHLLALWTFALGVAISYQPPVMEPVVVPEVEVMPLSAQWPDPNHAVVVWRSNTLYTTGQMRLIVAAPGGSGNMVVSGTQTLGAGAATPACMIQDAKGEWRLCRGQQ